MSNTSTTIRKHTVAVIGAGAGGAAVAARLRRQQADLDIAVIDPSEHHDYQPAWTLVGGGACRAQDTRRTLRDCLPATVSHIARRVVRLLPEENRVELDDGTSVAYDYLVVAAGIQINWDAIEGLAEALGKNGVTSNYRYDHDYSGCHGDGCRVDNPDAAIDNRPQFDKYGEPNFDVHGNYQGCHGVGCLVDDPDDDQG